MNTNSHCIRSLVALFALGAIFGNACADVAISGTVDQGIAHREDPKKTEVTHGATSKLTFRVDEDLGDGTKAYAVVQHRFNADSGQARNPFWYYSYVGLKGGLGDLRIGNQKSPIDDATTSEYDVWDGDTVGGSISRIGGGQKVWANAINYSTPTFGGFRIHTGVSAAEGLPKTVLGKGVSLIYEAGGLSAAVSSQVSPTNVQTDAIGGRYTFDRFRVFGTYAKGKRVEGTKDQTDWQVSAGYFVIKPGEIRLLYNRTTVGTAQTEVLSLGYFHNLSRRTALYGAIANVRKDDTSSSGAYQAGIRHDF